tara:strand:- start:204 stop:428 length:225 start_codon:yes stop_codon:yes gene_type:complete
MEKTSIDDGMLIPSDEDQEGSVSAAYNSVDIINKSEDDEEVSRNVEHIRIMMGIDWFFKKLTVKQKKELKEIIK